jgi:CelD/BcsL family acetyltransferase involved in cellulose biosynthesis
MTENAHIVPLALAPADLVDAWRDLAGRALEPNPFFEPDFVLPAARHLPGGAGLALATADDHGRLAAAVPVHRTRRWRKMPAPGWAVWRHDYAFLATPLVAADPSVAVGALGELLGELRSRRTPAFYIALDWAGDGGAVSEALEKALDTTAAVGPVMRYETFERAFLCRRPEATYLDGMKGSHRKELRRLRRGLEREAGSPLTTVDRAGERQAVDQFLALEAEGWKGRAGTAMAQRPGHADFFHEVCARFAAAGRLQLLSLEAGGTPVAMKCNLIAGEGLFTFKIAFDEKLSKFSPGMQLELDNVELFHNDEAVTWMDSCAEPSNEMINRLWPDRRTVSTFMVPLGAPGRAIAAGLSVRERVKRTA